MLKKQSLRYILPLILLVNFAVLVREGYRIWNTDDQWGRIVQGDGEGYYAYLPALFIHHDLDNRYELTVATGMQRKQSYYLDFRHRTKSGEMMNRYYCGTSVCLMPFFLGGHLAAKLEGKPQNGYSRPYFLAVIYAAAFFASLGLWSMVRLLGRMGFNTWISLFCVLAVCWGTNLYYYTVGEPSMSHVYSFGVISAFLLALHRFVKRQTAWSLILVAFLLALTIIIRPVNGTIVLLFPFMAGSWSNTVAIIKKMFSRRLVIGLLAGIIIAVTVVFIQLLYYKVQVGHWFEDSYGGFGFNFTHPHIIDFLFSYKKGWFVYTPLAFLATIGLIGIWKRSRFRAIWLAGYILLTWWLLASWEYWWYGGSFSQRPMVEYLGIWILLLAYLISMTSYWWLRGIFCLLVLVLVYVNQVQTKQYRNADIHWEEMDKEKFWKSFERVFK